MMLIIMCAMPLIIVLIVGAAVMKSEAEEETFKEGQRRNSIVSEHIESTKILSHSEF